MSREAALLVVFLGACAHHTATPILASDVAEGKRGASLSAYLAQRDANATVCDLKARGPHIAVVNAAVRNDLMKGLSDRRIPPPLWRQCVDAIVRSADRETNAALFDEVRLALAKHRLDSLAIRYVTAYVAAMEPIRGLRNGQPVDVVTLDELFRARDDSTLKQYADRLPDSSLRIEARRRAIRLRMAQSPYAWVRDNAATVEQSLMNSGVDRVRIEDHPLVGGAIDDAVRTARVVLVRQDVEHQTSTLVGSYDDDSVVSVLPQLSLRGALHLQLQGVDQPVTLCPPPEALDPSPCLLATEVSLGNPMAYLEADGTIRFVERITSGETARLAAQQERFVVPVVVHGQQLTALDWALRFVTPNELVLAGGSSGGHGPDLRIRLDVLAANRLSYTVSRGSRQYVAIVERPHWRDFDVLSEGGGGAAGMDGSNGRDGFSGTPGTNAICPSSPGANGGRGEDGTPGGDGGPGGHGGDGGNVLVKIHATGALASELVSLAHWTVASRGGHGGSGGSGGLGGRGGSGGSGGMGATCFDAEGHSTSLSGGSSGFSGSDGRNGMTGTSGASGRNGIVTVRVIGTN